MSWNRGKGANTDRIKNASGKPMMRDTIVALGEAVLGQTVRIKSLEKKAELNGRRGLRPIAACLAAGVVCAWVSRRIRSATSCGSSPVEWRVTWL